MNAIPIAAVSPLALIMRGFGLLTEDIDDHPVRASMVIMFFLFGYQKLWLYEAERHVPFISNGSLIWWLHPVLVTRVQAGFSVFPSGHSAVCYLPVSATSGSVLLKDVVLLAMSFYLLRRDVVRVTRQASPFGFGSKAPPFRSGMNDIAPGSLLRNPAAAQVCHRHIEGKVR